MTKKKPDGFIGRFDRKIGRDKLLTIPAEWVALMGGSKGVVVLPDPKEKCLDLMPEATYAEGVELPLRKAATDAATRKELECIERDAVHLEMCGGSVISIPRALLKFAAIKDCVTLLGALRYVQIWSTEVFQSSVEVLDSELERCLAEAGLGDESEMM